LSLKNHNNNDKFKKNSLITGTSIFLINCILLWIPSKFMLREISKKNNIFKFIENIFIFPKILLNINKYKYFIKIDKNGDGFINYNEFKQYYKNKFKKLDTDKSNKLSINEFLEFYNYK
jgi:hypothetical protein